MACAGKSIAMSSISPCRARVGCRKQPAARRGAFRNEMPSRWAVLNDFRLQHNPDGDFLFESFGWAEAGYTPFFMRFGFLAYYGDFALPNSAQYARVKRRHRVAATDTELGLLA
jgi:hypothetical protein